MKTSHETLERIRKAARENDDLTRAELARRFGCSEATVRKALQNNAAKGGLRFPRGTSVKVLDPDSNGSKARTGVVTDDALDFPWRDHRRVEFDFVPGQVTTALVPASDLREIKPSERAESARPREQVALFEGASS